MNGDPQNTTTTPFDLLQPIPAARPLSDFAVEQVGDDLVILDAETLQYHTLNETAAWIWQNCDGVATSALLGGELGVPIEIVESTVAELGEAGLLQSPSTRWDSSLNRRRAAKLIAAGLIGAVGLPVIKSITAPDSASAASIGQCAFGFSAGGWICGLCRRFGCRCEPVTIGGSGYCCVCGGTGLRAAGGVSESEFFAAVAKAQKGEPLTQSDDDVIQGVYGGEELISDDPYLSTDESGNVDLDAIDAQATEQAGVQQPATDGAPAGDATATEDAGAQPAPAATDVSATEPAATSSDGDDQEAGA